jgi:MFS family permease
MHLLWLLAAVGGGVYHPVANVLITRLYPERKGHVIGLTGMGAAIGFALSPLMTTGLVALFSLGWQEIALVFGVFGVVASLWVYAVVQDVEDGALGNVAAVPETPPAPAVDAAATPAPVSSTDAADSAPSSGGLSAIAGVLIAIIFITGTREMAMWSVLDISDFFLIEVLEGARRTGLFLFLLYAPGILIQPLAGSLSDAIGRRWLATGAFVLYGVSVGAAGMLPPALVFVAYLGMGVGQGASIPIVEAFVADFAGPQLRGVAYGAFFTAGIALGALGPGGTGGLVDLMGGGLDAFKIVLAGLGGLVLIAAAFMPFVIRGQAHARQA